MHQYLAWFKRGVDYPSGNKLTPVANVNKLKAALLPTGVEVHESVQRYDQLGRVLYTPLYADFDGPESVGDVDKFVKLTEVEFGVTPDVYFSGNRGYHTFINIPVTHAHPHLVAQMFMNIMSQSVYLDAQMYVSRHLLRSEGSIHFKTNLFKTKLDRHELLDVDNTLTKARKQRVSQVFKHESPKLELYLKGLYQQVDSHVAELEEKYKTIRSEANGDVPPCIRSLIKQGPVAGSNNYILQLIARSYNNSGVAMDKAVADVLSNPLWFGKQNEVMAVMKSTYKGTSRFGCKGNATLKQFCDEFCPFNEINIDIT